MIAIMDILKAADLYRFMGVKERLLTSIDSILGNTEYSGKYGLSGSFASTDQTISIVVGILGEKVAWEFISSGLGKYINTPIPSWREYTYGINITGPNDEEVRVLAQYLRRKLIDEIPEINYDLGVRVFSDFYTAPMAVTSGGDKKLWHINIFVTVAINELYAQPEPIPYNSSNGLDADGYVIPGYSSCVVIKGQ